uniref:Ig-like domain-containing protein n=1 Tax=Oncorhynchus tshawytscha TaxID=74940 RepID=A0A8C8IZI8_ONCTS
MFSPDPNFSYGGLGREITLTPKVSGQPEDILWKHNGNKVVEFDRSQNVEYGRYKGRTILDWDSGALTIKGLTDADSGPYELEAVVKGKLQYSQHKVGVIDDVAQPSATCVVDTTTPENMDRTLLCSADLQPLTQFIWRSPEGSESPGPELFIPGGENQDSENQESIYTCVVKNPVSEKSAEFTLKNCYTGKITLLNCSYSNTTYSHFHSVVFTIWIRERTGGRYKTRLFSCKNVILNMSSIAIDLVWHHIHFKTKLTPYHSTVYEYHYFVYVLIE